EAMQNSANKLLSISTSYDGTIIKLKVSDTGQGMSTDTLSNLFNPFYSTKVEGGGTGLGLASLKALMEPYGVKISVESELGKGSDFCLAINPLLVNAGYQDPPAAGRPQSSPAAIPPLHH
ncbi:MAG: ATP-binding protein, partial [Immundisolibacteraceae bacterium]|nr:ATP-binding protein [Immundisolibacteraceae bacterium]